MRANEETVLIGEKVVLVPYRKEHVQKYNDWMQDAELQELTASEPLTLDEEYEMQRSWHLDEDKLTFIVLHRNKDVDFGAESEISALLSRCQMAGDVNVFISDLDDDDEPDDDAAHGTNAKAEKKGELEVMIAEPSLRRHGLAREAVKLLLRYITAAEPPSGVPVKHTSQALPLSPCNLFVKISLSNKPSIDLFRSLGFKEHKVSEVWQEVEMRLTTGKTHHDGDESFLVRHWSLAA
ncbi:unnamed protein product [Parajaminaea phylloscopi]